MRIIAPLLLFVCIAVVVMGLLYGAFARSEAVRRARIVANGCEDQAWCWEYLAPDK